MWKVFRLRLKNGDYHPGLITHTSNDHFSAPPMRDGHAFGTDSYLRAPEEGYCSRSSNSCATVLEWRQSEATSGIQST
ncbi:unnamed protein product [Onchocerca flexuosa]|uniref:Uncharacterized protein n=1 Tax=Onchocerca flexuosa TaxID=387005 RepID=A0A183H2J3_9BILA|nr:unnamed protein product [Onchocerca flexuosa]